jgi:hypothetical protein
MSSSTTNTNSPLGQTPPCTTYPSSIIPTCIWGTCIVTNNNTKEELICQCYSGFRHDQLTGRYLNCGLPNWAPWVGGVFSIFICTMASIFNTYILIYKSQPKTSLRRMAIAGVVAAISFDAAAICLHADEKLQMPWWGAIFNNIGTSAIAVAMGIAVTTALKPIAMFSHIKTQIKPLRFLVYFIIPSWLLWGCFICTIAGHATHNDQWITEAMGFVYVILGVAGLICVPLFYHYMTLLVHALDEAVSGTERIDQHNNNNNNTGHKITNRTSLTAGGGGGGNENSQYNNNNKRMSITDQSGMDISPTTPPPPTTMTNPPPFLTSPLTSTRMGGNTNNGTGFVASISTRFGFMIRQNTESKFIPMKNSSSPAGPGGGQSAGNPSNTSKKKIITTRDKITRLRAKVSALRITSVGAACLLVITCAIASGFQFGARTFPFSWLFYYVVTCAIGLFSAQLTHYAKRETSKKNNQKHSGVGNNNNNNNNLVHDSSSNNNINVNNNKIGGDQIVDGTLGGIATADHSHSGQNSNSNNIPVTMTSSIVSPSITSTTDNNNITTPIMNVDHDKTPDLLTISPSNNESGHLRPISYPKAAYMDDQ